MHNHVITELCTGAATVVRPRRATWPEGPAHAMTSTADMQLDTSGHNWIMLHKHQHRACTNRLTQPKCVRSTEQCLAARATIAAEPPVVLLSIDEVQGPLTKSLRVPTPRYPHTHGRICPQHNPTTQSNAHNAADGCWPPHSLDPGVRQVHGQRLAACAAVAVEPLDDHVLQRRPAIGEVLAGAVPKAPTHTQQGMPTTKSHNAKQCTQL